MKRSYRRSNVLILLFAIASGCSSKQGGDASPDAPRAPGAAAGGSGSVSLGAGASSSPGQLPSLTDPMGDAPALDPGVPSGSAGSGPLRIDRTRGKLPDAVVDQLTAGGGAAGAMAFLYPYDKTVFPGGLLAPVIQWRKVNADDAIDGVYLHLHSKSFDYREVFSGSEPRLQVPIDAWNAAAQQSLGAADPTTVELTTVSAGVVSGTISQSWIFARGQMKSAVYYNTYNSAKVVPNNGAVMRILPLASEPEVVKTVAGGLTPVGPCFSCHSLSANGQMLVAQRHQYPGGPYTSNSFDVATNSQVDPPALATNLGNDADWGFSAVYPDGSRILTAAQPATAGKPPDTFPFAPQNNPGMIGPRASKLFDARTGAVLASPGLVVNAKMPSFSPDGKKVVFNDHDHGQGHSLAVMDFDAATNTFSNRKQIFRDDSSYPGWPFFTPDGQQVVFAAGNGSDYATVQDPPAGTIVNRSNLFVVDLAGQSVRALRLGNGGELPSRDQNLNYYPTVSPVAAGGYFWVFFTSRRSYGNLMEQPEIDSVTKKIWVAAVDIESGDPDAAPRLGDPSHPAFYLPGQELGSGNIRAFATLSPCKATGAECTSGLDCCGGFCTDGQCVVEKPACASIDDTCASSADCCQTGEPLTCIANRCTTPPAPPVIR